MLEFAGIKIPFNTYERLKGVSLGSPLRYKCPRCEETFSSVREVTEHMASAHPKPSATYACPKCGETFSSVREVTEHMASAHPKPSATYECPKCGETFSSAKEAAEHILSAHPKPSPPKIVKPPITLPPQEEVAPLPGLAPWPPVAKFAPIIPPEGELPMPIMAPITSISDIMKFITTPPPEIVKPPITLPPLPEEPWELAEVAVAPAPPKKITPYLILAGLAVTTLAVWSYKKKKKRGVEAKK